MLVMGVLNTSIQGLELTQGFIGVTHGLHGV